MICFPNAKINLGLHIVSRRQDGYHNLETVFYPIGLKEALEIVPIIPDRNSAYGNSIAGSTVLSNAAPAPDTQGLPAASDAESALTRPYRFFQSGNVMQGREEDNLVIKALKLMAASHHIPNIDIHLLKKIPSGAGLGGGSSDAAFMLRLLNDSFGLGYTDRELARLGTQLGADCPFFIYNKPAFATGIGETLEPLDISLSDLFLVLVKPQVTVSTREAYAMITPHTPEVSLKEIVKKPLSEWKEQMKNDFETPVFKKYPEICTIKQQLYDLGAAYASMSGSGSSVYGFFHTEPDLKDIFSKHFVWTNKEGFK